MARTVLRYPINQRDGQCMVAVIPFSARVLKAAPRPADGEPSVWALVDSEALTGLTKRVCIAGTGCALPENGAWDHVETFFVDAFVFHVFEESR